MVGRQVYHDPALLKHIDFELYGESQNNLSESDLIEIMCDYAARHIVSGGRLSHVTRHMIGLFHGREEHVDGGKYYLMRQQNQMQISIF